MMQRDDVEFAVEGGLALRGWLFPPGSAATSGHHHGTRLRRREGAASRKGNRVMANLHSERLLDAGCQRPRPATRGR
jgi:hypothetical protein